MEYTFVTDTWPFVRALLMSEAFLNLWAYCLGVTERPPLPMEPENDRQSLSPAGEEHMIYVPLFRCIHLKFWCKIQSFWCKDGELTENPFRADGDRNGSNINQPGTDFHGFIISSILAVVSRINEENYINSRFTGVIFSNLIGVLLCDMILTVVLINA